MEPFITEEKISSFTSRVNEAWDKIHESQKKDVIITFCINVDGSSSNSTKQDIATLIEQYKDFGKDSGMRVHQIWLPVKNQLTEVKIMTV